MFSFKRRSSYFIIQVYLPTIIIVMVTWLSFWISPSAVPARTGICITAILTILTMLGISNSNMPKVSYIKALDLYLFVCFVFVFLSFIEYIIVLNVRKRCRSCFGESPKEEKKIKSAHEVCCFNISTQKQEV